MLLLQHAHDRYETYRSAAPWRRDQQLGSICVFDADLIAAVFRSGDFHVIDYHAAYSAIMDKTGIDLGAILTALSHIPLANEGERHKRLRNEMAQILGGGLRRHRATIEEEIGSLVANVVRPGRRIDLTQEIFLPAYNRVFGLVLGIDHGRADPDPMISQIFDKSISLNRRKKMQAAIADFGDQIDDQDGAITIDRNLVVALTILGHDAMIGSLVNSAWHVFETNSGSRLSDIVFPELLAATAVPYIERIAIRDTEIGGLEVKKGERVRLFLDAASGRAANGSDPDLFFGRGRHLCLGKPISMLIWQAFARAIGCCNHTVFTEELKIRPRDYVFTYAEHAWIRIAD